jgi:hypothetical protein
MDRRSYYTLLWSTTVARSIILVTPMIIPYGCTWATSCTTREQCGHSLAALPYYTLPSSHTFGSLNSTDDIEPLIQNLLPILRGSTQNASSSDNPVEAPFKAPVQAPVKAPVKASAEIPVKDSAEYCATPVQTSTPNMPTYMIPQVRQ